MKIGKLAQADIALCRLRVAYILCQSWLADEGANQSDLKPAWEGVSYWGFRTSIVERYEPCDGTLGSMKVRIEIGHWR